MKPQPHPPSCEGCPANEWGVGFVPPEVPRRQVDLVIVGQGPGETEARFSRPFHPEAPTGKTLTRWLYESGFQRTRTLITNVVWCWLPERKVRGMPQGNRMPKAAETAHCRRAHLDPLLAQYKDKLTALVGTPATQSLLGLDKVSKYTGTFVRRDDGNP